EVAQVGIDTARELLEHMRVWQSLAKSVPALLYACLAISTVLAGLAFTLAFKKDINGSELALLIFVLALFAVSPSVLFLLERPLKGIDDWSPSGGASDSSAGSGTAAAPADKTAKPDA